MKALIVGIGLFLRRGIVVKLIGAVFFFFWGGGGEYSII